MYSVLHSEFFFWFFSTWKKFDRADSLLRILNQTAWTKRKTVLNDRISFILKGIGNWCFWFQDYIEREMLAFGWPDSFITSQCRGDGSESILWRHSHSKLSLRSICWNCSMIIWYNTVITVYFAVSKQWDSWCNLIPTLA